MKKTPTKQQVNRAGGEQAVAATLLGAIWQKYHYFFWVWLFITTVVLVGYQTSFDRERICTYQYCPSSWVLAACTTCIMLATVWANIFFAVIRPLLQLWCGRLLGTRVRNEEDDDNSVWYTLFYEGSKEFWSAAPGASIFQHTLVVLLDYLCVLLFLMLPMAAIIALSSGIAYLEQKNSPTPPGLQTLPAAGNDPSQMQAKP